MVAHTCHPSTWVSKAEDYEFKANVCYLSQKRKEKVRENINILLLLTLVFYQFNSYLH